MVVNGVNSTITASSILRNINIDKVDGDAPSIDTRDALVKSEGSEFKKTDFLKIDANTKKGSLIGAGAGAVGGGIAGGILAYNMSISKINAVDLQSISVNWSEPVLKSENLGQIPANYYQTAGSPETQSGFQDIYKNNPVMAGNKPLMQEFSREYSGYGKPVLSWDKHDIMRAELNGYHEAKFKDITVDNSNRRSQETINGFEHRFNPMFTHTEIGTYKTPSVSFDTGVNTALNTTFGIVAGAGLGAIAGGLTGGIIANAIRAISESSQEG